MLLNADQHQPDMHDICNRLDRFTIFSYYQISQPNQNMHQLRVLLLTLCYNPANMLILSDGATFTACPPIGERFRGDIFFCPSPTTAQRNTKAGDSFFPYLIYLI